MAHKRSSFASLTPTHTYTICSDPNPCSKASFNNACVSISYLRDLVVDVTHASVSLTVTSLLLVMRNLIKPFWPCGECMDIYARFVPGRCIFDSCRHLLHPIAAVRPQLDSLTQSCWATEPPLCTHWSQFLVPILPSAKRSVVARTNGWKSTLCWLGILVARTGWKGQTV